MSAAPDFTQALCRAVLDAPVASSVERATLTRCIADTIAVAAAGFVTPAIDATARAMAGDGGRMAWSRTALADSHGAVFVNGAASHMLDFDDLHVASSAHLSAVLVPALLVRPVAADPNRLLAALHSGFVAATALARRLGAAHYRQGWHATGTIGAMAATAACARLSGLTEVQLRHAFALAAAQAGGLHVNFGTMAKPLHAGFAAATAVRSVALAAGGITGAEDVFAPGGFFDLYGGDDGEPVDDFGPGLDSLSVKLFPCCFAAHRLIGAALQARSALGPLGSDDSLRFVLTVPAQSTYVLRYDRPQTAAEAAFSAPYTVAVALIDGPPGLRHFSAEALLRPDLKSMLPRITVRDDPTQPSGGRLDTGSVRLDVYRGDDIVGRFEQAALPGSRDDTDIGPALRVKIADCLGRFHQATGRPFPPITAARACEGVSEWLPN